MTPAPIDALAHHLRWHPAALDAAPAGAADRVARADAVTARWIAQGDALRRQAWRLHETLGPQPDQVAPLSRLIDQADAQVDAFARRYREIEERLGRTGPRSPGEARADALLGALARYGLAQADFVLFLRALRDANRSPVQTSPVFDDGDALIAHLRAALA